MIFLKKFFYKATSCLTLVALLAMVLLTLNGCKKSDNSNITTLRLGEVTHSPFYAPLYVAIEKGYFEEEGLKIDLSLISGANNVTAAVLSEDIDIGFCGPEATIYIYNGGEKDYIQTFAGLTKRDGQFLVSKEKIENFDWSMLEGKKVLAGRIGGMPELNFENALKNANVSKSKVDIDTSVDFASLTSAFIAGEGDFVNLFEPNATLLEKMGYGYVVTSIGEKSGEMPYTAFNARKSYIEANEDKLVAFTKAITKGLEYCAQSSSEDIANTIASQFRDTSLNDLIAIVERYKEADSWLSSTHISEEMFENLEDIMLDSKQITERVPFEDLVLDILK